MMHVTDFILALLGSNIITTIVTTLLNRRAYKIQNKVDEIKGLQEHIQFLNEQIDRLENRVVKLDSLVCYAENCKLRHSQ